jgi:hypothetical protein
MGESETAVAGPPWYQSTLLWGCIGAFLAIVVTVVATMVKDIRWLLLAAWPFAVFAAWEFARTWSNRRTVVWSISFSATIIIGALLGWLYLALAPKEEQTTEKPRPPIAQPSPPSEPWVSEEEAQKAKKDGRVLLPFRPSELSSMNYRMGSEGTEAYVGTWVKIDDLLLMVSADKDKKDSLRVRILQPIWSAILIFDAKKWGDQLRALNPNAGAKVRALCQLAKYDKESGNTDMSVPKFVGSNCELF